MALQSERDKSNSISGMIDLPHCCHRKLLGQRSAKAEDQDKDKDQDSDTTFTRLLLSWPSSIFQDERTELRSADCY